MLYLLACLLLLVADTSPLVVVERICCGGLPGWLLDHYYCVARNLGMPRYRSIERCCCPEIVVGDMNGG
jgi:hypothetical protein